MILVIELAAALAFSQTTLHSLAPNQAIELPLPVAQSNLHALTIDGQGMLYRGTVLDSQGRTLMQREVEGGIRHPIVWIHVPVSSLRLRIESTDPREQTLRTSWTSTGRVVPAATIAAAEQAMDTGHALAAQFQQDAAREQFLLAAGRFREAKTPGREAEALLLVASSYFADGKMTDAEKAYRQSETLWREADDLAGEGRVCLQIATLYNDTNRLKEAASETQRCTELYGRLNDDAGRGEALLGASTVEFRANRFESNEKILLQVAELARRLPSRKLEADALNLLAINANVRRNGKARDEYYRQSLAIRRQIRDLPGQGQTISNLGSSALTSGDPLGAIEYLEEALAIRRKIGNEQAIGNTLFNLGVARTELGEYETAMALLEQSKAIFERTQGKRGVAYCLLDLSKSALGLGLEERARNYANASFKIWAELRDAVGQILALQVMGDLSELSKAGEFYRQALGIATAAGSPLQRARILVSMAWLESRNGNRQAAVTNAEEAVRLSREAGTPLFQSAALNVLANNEPDWNTATGHFLESIAIARDGSYRPRELRARQDFARALSAHGQNDEASSEFRQAVALAEGIRGNQMSEENRVQWLANRQSLFRETIEHLARAGAGAPVTLHFNERFRARAMLDQVVSARSVKEEAWLAAEPLTASAIQQTVLREGEVLLEYLLGPAHSYLWIVSRSTIRMVMLPSEHLIVDLAKGLAQQIEEPGRSASGETAAAFRDRVEKSRIKLEQVAERLSAVILPASAEVRGARRVVVVAGGDLSAAPFALLAPLQGKEILLAPSASVLGHLRGVKRDAGMGITVFADPVYSPRDSRVRVSGAVAEGKSEWRRLRSSRDEAEAIRTLDPGAKLLLDFGASRNSFSQSVLRQAAIVHFAAHAIADVSRPERSGLVLSTVREDGSIIDGVLRLRDVQRMRINARLVVLSACQTLRGKSMPGEGMMSTARAFLYAGAQGVAATLWNADDRSTTLLMSEFYRGLLKDKTTPAQALLRAQSTLRAKPEWRHPYYWANFVLFGEGSAR